MNIRFGRAERWRLLFRLAASAAVAALVAGCATGSAGPAHTGSIGSTTIVSPSDLTPEQAVAAVQKWGAAYSKDEKDRVAALNYAAALRGAGQTGQGVAVMRKAVIYHPEDREILANYGKALAADGQFATALETIKRAQYADNPDWQLLSTEGGILDSLDRHEEARARYQQAQVLAPGEPQILNNLGLSYLLTNELEKAEEVLRQAVASPKATIKMRQNLALVLRLRGKEEEAALVAPPPAESAPVAQSEENTWDELARNE